MKTSNKIKAGLTTVATYVAREFRTIATSYSILLVMIGGIFIYGLLYNYMYAPNLIRNAPVAVVDRSGTPLSREYARLLNASPQVEIYSYAPDMPGAKIMMETNRVVGIIFIPEDFEGRVGRGEQAVFLAYGNTSAFLNFASVEEAAAGAMEELDAEKARLVTDDCSLFELTGRPVQLTQGDYANLKITTREDLPRAEQKEGNDMRIGHGYDVHRLVEGRKLILGGVEIPYEKGLLGHSDADVLLHAVMDAVLGAAALGDIGQHFPDNDPAYKGADSLALTREVARIIAEHGYKVGNIDATILCQRPKLAPHIPAMRRNIADAFGLPVDAVSVKATTEEHLGFTGEGLGIAAHAVALIE